MTLPFARDCGDTRLKVVARIIAARVLVGM
jgi:hypothetical protein